MMSEEKKTTEDPKKTMLELAGVSVLLDSYDDIFSSFDPSDYDQKTLSDDFITQAQNILKSKSEHKMVLNLLLPEKKRDKEIEKVIVKRLHSYFQDIYQQMKLDLKKRNQRGWILSTIGVLIMAVASYISFIKPNSYPVHFLLVICEPAGWFLLWAGLDYLVWSSKETKKDLAFNLRMSESEIKFNTY
ncbi:MAG: hypothetical protein M3R27_14080 [Bacteroidota bacterium]|nr:hypothetical protein [Bacteroidota bacterium]